VVVVIRAPDVANVGPAVSVVVCTKRPNALRNLLENYTRQTYWNKELIIVLNNDQLNPDDYARAAQDLDSVRIYRLPERATLGSCLNFAVKRARHALIAKFDDDDYFAPNYLADSVRTMRRSGADIVGKRAHFMVLGNKPPLLYRYPTQANRFVPLVQGATLLVKRHVFEQVRFPDRNRGECVRFCAACRAHGFRIYAGSPFHFLARRRRNSRNHTWIVSDRVLLTRNVRVLRVKAILPFISGERVSLRRGRADAPGLGGSLRSL
jgi:glycosyltransferase involved in cell wall biosynthesis